jgi:hypothetical protein
LGDFTKSSLVTPPHLPPKSTHAPPPLLPPRAYDNAPPQANHTVTNSFSRPPAALIVHCTGRQRASPQMHNTPQRTPPQHHPSLRHVRAHPQDERSTYNRTSLQPRTHQLTLAPAPAAVLHRRLPPRHKLSKRSASRHGRPSTSTSCRTTRYAPPPPCFAASWAYGYAG